MPHQPRKGDRLNHFPKRWGDGGRLITGRDNSLGLPGNGPGPRVNDDRMTQSDRVSLVCQTMGRPWAASTIGPATDAGTAVQSGEPAKIAVFLEPTDRTVIRPIWSLLREAPDWRVRFAAWETLTELGDLPDNYQLPLLDRLRARLLSPQTYQGTKPDVARSERR